MNYVMNGELSQNRIKTIHEILGFEAPPEELPHAQAAEAAEVSEGVITIKKRENFFKRDIVRYPLIFLVALGFFYIILNFRAVAAQFSNTLRKPAKNDEVVLKEKTPAYNKWIKKYYTYVGNQEVLAANNDADSDGLTNFDEFYIGTNPLKADTDRDGYDDGREILNGYNPSYEGKLTARQREIIAAHLDLGAISSRKEFRILQDVAGKITNLPVDGFQLDRSRTGRIEIPKLGIDAPIIWTKEFSQIQEDLKNGVAHHPATAFPGEPGLSSLHGHSSGYPWDGNYKYAFTKINFLEAGDEVFATVYGTNGSERRFRYLVREKTVYQKTDSGQFAERDGHFLNLSTSWPIGSAKERYVVTTELVGL